MYSITCAAQVSSNSILQLYCLYYTWCSSIDSPKIEVIDSPTYTSKIEIDLDSPKIQQSNSITYKYDNNYVECNIIIVALFIVILLNC